MRPRGADRSGAPPHGPAGALASARPRGSVRFGVRLRAGTATLRLRPGPPGRSPAGSARRARRRDQVGGPASGLVPISWLPPVLARGRIRPPNPVGHGHSLLRSVKRGGSRGMSAARSPGPSARRRPLRGPPRPLASPRPRSGGLRSACGSAVRDARSNSIRTTEPSPRGIHDGAAMSGPGRCAASWSTVGAGFGSSSDSGAFGRPGPLPRGRVRRRLASPDNRGIGSTVSLPGKTSITTDGCDLRLAARLCRRRVAREARALVEILSDPVTTPPWRVSVKTRRSGAPQRRLPIGSRYSTPKARALDRHVDVASTRPIARGRGRAHLRGSGGARR